MKIGEIKIEALKLMFTNYSFDMSIDDLPNMISDENYGSYIVNMNGSICRAIDRIQNACVVPTKLRLINESELVIGKYFARFDTSLISDFFIIDRVVAECENVYNGNVEYNLEGSNLVLERGATYTVLYYPALKTIDDNMGDTDDIGLPDNIARLIAYFVKSELYQEEEPSVAADARNIFEMSLDDIKGTVQSKQTRIKRVI